MPISNQYLTHLQVLALLHPLMFSSFMKFSSSPSWSPPWCPWCSPCSTSTGAVVSRWLLHYCTGKCFKYWGFLRYGHAMRELQYSARLYWPRASSSVLALLFIFTGDITSSVKILCTLSSPSLSTASCSATWFTTGWLAMTSTTAWSPSGSVGGCPPSVC